MATGYDNEIVLLRKQVTALEAQVVSLASIDRKTSIATATSTTEATAEKLTQEFQRSIQEEVLLQLKILTKHWEIANGEVLTEQDLL